MKWGRSLSLVAATALAGTSLLVVSPAGAIPRNDKPVTVHGQRFDSEAPTRKVSYSDLNLASLAGEKTLNRRVRGAVTQVCAESVPSGDFYLEMACQNFAWNGARPQISQAVMRARQIASTGSSTILPVAITLAFPK